MSKLKDVKDAFAYWKACIFEDHYSDIAEIADRAIAAKWDSLSEADRQVIIDWWNSREIL